MLTAAGLRTFCPHFLRRDRMSPSRQPTGYRRASSLFAQRITALPFSQKFAKSALQSHFGNGEFPPRSQDRPTHHSRAWRNW